VEERKRKENVILLNTMYYYVIWLLLCSIGSYNYIIDYYWLERPSVLLLFYIIVNERC